MYPHLYLYIVIVNCISSSSFAYHPHSHIDFTINIYSLFNNHYYHFYTSSSTFICIVQYIHIHPNLYIITILLYIFIIILYHHHLGTIFSKSLLKTIYHHVTQSSSRLRKIHHCQHCQCHCTTGRLRYYSFSNIAKKTYKICSYFGGKYFHLQPFRIFCKHGHFPSFFLNLCRLSTKSVFAITSRISK